MAIYNHPAWIYFNDTEFFELLSNLGHRELLKIARARGLIFSEKAPDASVRSALSLLPSNWPLVTEIYSFIAKPDPAERKSALQVHGCKPESDMVTIAQTVRDERQQKNEETYEINQDEAGRTRVVVVYTETDLTKALQYSRRQRSVEIEVVKDGENITFSHDASEKARAIVKQMAEKIEPANQAKPLQEVVISLKSIRDATLRTKFFTELLKGIDAQTFISASHVNVDCRLGKEMAVPDGDEDNGEDKDEGNGKEAKTKAKQIKSIINKMSFSGEQVLGAELYQQAAESGYFITQINWTSEDKKKLGTFIDYIAGFGDPIGCDHFSYDVHKRWQRAADNADKTETLPLSGAERRALNSLIQSGADKAFLAVMAAAQEKGKKKA